MIRFRTLLPAAMVVAVACESATEPPTAGPLIPLAPSAAVFDAAPAGASGVYFLPPLASPSAWSGPFDSGLEPVLEVCADASCTTPHAVFGPDGQGSEAVRVDLDDEHYIANWNTEASGAEAGRVYTVRVRVGDGVLASIDVAVVRSGGEAAALRREGRAALVAGQTLPIKVRIETGIAGSLAVTPAEASVEVGGNAAFAATVLDLHGQPLPDASPTWSSSDAAVATVDASGEATGEGAGTAWIRAAWGSLADSAAITVTEPEGPGGGDPDTRGYAYVTSTLANTVTVLNRAGEVLTTIAVDPTPFRIALNPDGTRAYVTHAGSGRTVTVLDLESNSVVNSIPVGSRPIDVHYDALRDLVYVGNEVSRTISIIDAATETVVATVPMPTGHGASYLSPLPGGGELLVSGCGVQNVAVFDVEARAVSESVPVDPSAWCVSGLAPWSDGRHAYALSSGQDALLLLDLDDRTSTVVASGAFFGDASGAVLMSPDGARAYVANQFGGAALPVVNTTTHDVETTFTTDYRASAMALSADGSHLWVVTGANTVNVVRLADGVVVAKTPVGSIPRGIALRD